MGSAILAANDINEGKAVAATRPPVIVTARRWDESLHFCNKTMMENGQKREEQEKDFGSSTHLSGMLAEERTTGLVLNWVRPKQRRNNDRTHHAAVESQIFRWQPQI